MDHIYLNGRILPAAEAALSPFDRGLLFGDGLFETVRIYQGRGHLLGRHLRRLAAGLDFLGIAHPGQEALAGAVRRTIDANDLGDGVLRLTVTRGVGGSVVEPELADGPTILITLRPLLQNPESDKSDKGERIITLGIRHMQPQLGRRLKSLNYLAASHAARDLAAAGVREGLLLTSDGTVAEGTVSNIFRVAGGAVITPPESLGILPGITRGRVIELARERGMEVRQERFALDDLLASDECFYTNSVREIVPVTGVDARTIGDGTPGTVTLRLRELYRAEAPA